MGGSKLFRARTPVAPPNAEQWVLRCIVVREGYIDQVKALVEQIIKRKAKRFGVKVPAQYRYNLSGLESTGGIWSHPFPLIKNQHKSIRSLADETASILHELRTITCETVEAVLNWRQKHFKRESVMVEEENEGA